MPSLLGAELVMCRVGYVPSLLCAELSHYHVTYISAYIQTYQSGPKVVLLLCLAIRLGCVQ